MLHRFKKTMTSIVLACCLLTLLSGCTTAPPHHQNNVCRIFRQYPEWYWAALATRKKWGVPISVMMAIIYQESHFRASALPPREHILWVIPWRRESSAYGYSQALDGTWKRYENSTDNHDVDRDEFGDAIHFIGWFGHRAHVDLKISMTNAYSMYLAYHEGIDGYRHRTYLRKHWLIDVARDVQGRAWMYRRQLLRCESSLPTKPWWKYIV